MYRSVTLVPVCSRRGETLLLPFGEVLPAAALRVTESTAITAASSVAPPPPLDPDLRPAPPPASKPRSADVVHFLDWTVFFFFFFFGEPFGERTLLILAS